MRVAWTIVGIGWLVWVLLSRSIPRSALSAQSSPWVALAFFALLVSTMVLTVLRFFAGRKP